MAERVFKIRTTPHRAVIGDTTLLYEPEAYGTEFVAEYNKLVEVQSRVGRKAAGTKANSSKHAKSSDINAEELAEVNAAMRGFVARFLLPESVPVFESMRIPDRILLELVEFAAELYGGGSGNPDADGGTSTD